MPARTMGEAIARASSVRVIARCSFDWQGRRVTAGSRLRDVSEADLRHLFKLGYVDIDL